MKVFILVCKEKWLNYAPEFRIEGVYELEESAMKVMNDLFNSIKEKALKDNGEDDVSIIDWGRHKSIEDYVKEEYVEYELFEKEVE